ncbi:MAG TPA: RNA 2',3'-cyclic phosphodiesterase [Candidatus Omnitrophota bacterium]|nr:RNA 2',3'-cyclic phosphodiesterase [Candidatus Omnitrophota bacterium]
MRLFIAVDLNSQNRDALAKLQTRLKKADTDVKWIEPKNIHLTLKFLGEVTEENIPKIISAIKESIQGIQPFSLEIINLGVFPSLEYPRVIWAGIEKGKEDLKKLAERVEAAMLKLKFPKEKRGFSEHLTLGRVRSSKNKNNLIQQLSQTSFPTLRQDIAAVILYQSTLTPQGPIYEKLGEASLQKI